MSDKWIELIIEALDNRTSDLDSRMNIMEAKLDSIISKLKRLEAK